jgi:hypothetical protein
MRALALLLLIAAIACAQFKSTSTLVIAPTTVTDSKGKYIDALEPADLVLYDNGVRQPIQVDESFNSGGGRAVLRPPAFRRRRWRAPCRRGSNRDAWWR